jgi:hypothetical protein
LYLVSDVLMWFAEWVIAAKPIHWFAHMLGDWDK